MGTSISLRCSSKKRPGSRLRLLALSCMLAFGMAVEVRAGQELHTLTITVENVSNSNGVIGALVFDSAAGWPEENTRAIRATSVPALRGSVVLSFPDLPPGRYAVVVLHDENENRKLDRRFGIPREQWGMS